MIKWLKWLFCLIHLFVLLYFFIKEYQLFFTKQNLFALGEINEFSDLKSNKTYNKKEATQLIKMLHDNKAASMDVTLLSSASGYTKKNVSQKCSSWQFPKVVKSYKRPQFKLKPNLLLYPGLIGGPSNQMMGLHHSIYIALKLNRTLVIPTFHAHKTHSGVLSPYQIVDVQRVCRFVSCTSIEEMRKTCNESFDAVFEAGKTGKKQVLRFENDTQMAIKVFPQKSNLLMTRTNSGKGNKSTVLFSKKLANQLPPQADSLRKFFNPEMPCTILTAIFHQVQITAKDHVAMPLRKNVKIVNADLSDLFSAVLDSVSHPPCIISAALEYIRDVLKSQKYIAVHWRYNKEDWMDVCIPKPFPLWCRKVCENINNIKPLHVAKAIASRAKYKLNKSQKNVYIYIATPTSLAEFRNNIFQELNNIDKAFRKPWKNITSFLSEKYHECWDRTGWDNIGEIVSLCEKEIMIHSNWFFFSTGSTWSNTVKQKRVKFLKNGKRLKLFTVNIFDLALEKLKSAA